MVIDIDGFLNKYDANPKEGKGKKREMPLEFQKSVEDKVRDVQNEGLEEDYDFLKKIYEEVKRFDEDLPNKFLGIEGKGSDALKTLSERYSKEFMKRVKENAKISAQQITVNLNSLDTVIKTNNFQEIVKEYDMLIKRYNAFPREFLSEKLKISNEIRRREIIIYEKLDLYKKQKLIEIKSRLAKIPNEMGKFLKTGYGKEMEDAINKTNYLLNSIPKLFMSDLAKERIELSKILLQAENFLEQEYLREFQEKEKIMNELFEKFQGAYMNSNVDRVLTTYDEILYQFNEIPEVFLEKKIAIYSKVNELYGSINKLILKRSVNTFLESYNYSRVIEEIRDYLDHARSIGKVDKDTLEVVKQKLISIPQKYSLEKKDLELKFKSLLDLLKSQNPASSQESNINFSAEFTSQSKKEEKPEFNPDSEIKKQSPSVSHNVRTEVSTYFNKIKASNSKSDLRVFYKKLMFYLNVTPMDPNSKKKIIQEVDEIIRSKRLN